MVLADVTLTDMVLETLMKQGLMGLLFVGSCGVIYKLFQVNQKLYLDRLVDQKNVMDDQGKAHKTEIELILQVSDKVEDRQKHLEDNLHDLTDEVSKSQRTTLDSVADVKRQIQEIRDTQVRIETKIDQRRSRNA